MRLPGLRKLLFNYYERAYRPTGINGIGYLHCGVDWYAGSVGDGCSVVEISASDDSGTEMNQKAESVNHHYIITIIKAYYMGPIRASTLKASMRLPSGHRTGCIQCGCRNRRFPFLLLLLLLLLLPSATSRVSRENGLSQRLHDPLTQQIGCESGGSVL